MNTKHVLGYPVTAILALGIGVAAGAGGTSASVPSASAPGPTVTATATVTATTPGAVKTVNVATPGPTATVTVETPGPTVETPGPTVTVTSPKPAKTVTVKVTPEPQVALSGDGTYEVGVDAKPGTYVSGTPDSGNCYWARLSGSDGLDDIIANNNSAGQSLVTIRASDKFFESSGCNDWTRR